MAILIKNPLHLGAQVWRITRGIVRPSRRQDGRTTTTLVPDPAFWEPKSCRDYGCTHYLLGWSTTTDLGTELGIAQADYVRKRCGRAFREYRDEHLQTVRHFVFESGQQCFRDHQGDAVGFAASGPHLKPIDRDPTFKNAIPGRDTRVMDYDEYFDTFNETVVRITQKQREV